MEAVISHRADSSDRVAVEVKHFYMTLGEFEEDTPKLIMTVLKQMISKSRKRH